MEHDRLGGFEPINDAHAIVAMNVLVQFSSAPDDSAWATVRREAFRLGRELKLGAPQRFMGVSVSFEQHKAAVSVNGGANLDEVVGFSFSSHDDNDNIIERIALQKNGISFTSWNYIRWSPIKKRISNILGYILPSYSFSSIGAVRTEYIDTFVVKDEGSYDSRAVVNDKSIWISPASIAADSSWHCHSGRFDAQSATVRRLTSTDIDFGDFPNRAGEIKRSLLIRTSMQDAFNAPGFAPYEGIGLSSNEVLSMLDDQHAALKVLLKAIITAEAAARIGL